MKIKEMEAAALEERKKAIAAEIDNEGADLVALEAEAREINAELEARKAEAEKKTRAREEVAKGAGNPIKTIVEQEERQVKTLKEIRSSEEYINAYAKYIKEGDDKEVRMLISANAPEGTEGDIVPVPTYLDERIQTAWENDPILSRVTRTYLRGNLEISFELSATGADIHPEGAEEPTEEELVLGTVKYIPEMIKKWISLTDTVAKLKGREFLDYIYDEITYRITMKAAELAVGDIVDAPAVSDATHIGVPVVNGAPSVTIIPTAAANLSSEAGTPIVIMNRLTDVEFLNAQVAGSFNVDPFAGLTRVYTSALPAYSAASSGDTYVIVGNLAGERFNFPDGDDVEIIYDPYTLSTSNKIRITGRYFAAHGVARLGHFVKVTK